MDLGIQSEMTSTKATGNDDSLSPTVHRIKRHKRDRGDVQAVLEIENGETDRDDSRHDDPHCLVQDTYRVNCHSGNYGLPHEYIGFGSLNADEIESIKSLMDVGNTNAATFCMDHCHELTRVKRLCERSCKGYLGNSHKRSVRASKLTAALYYKHYNGNSVGIFPGMSICRHCDDKLRQEPCHKTEENDVDDFTPPLEKYAFVNKLFDLAGMPLFRAGKLSRIAQANLIAQKLEALMEKCVLSLKADGLEVDIKVWNNKKLEQDFASVMTSLKQKYTNSDYRGKIQVLTVVPEKWTKKEVVQYFSNEDKMCPIYQIDKASKLRREEGPLALPQPRKGKGLPAETVKLVVEFYNDDVNSRQFAGMNDTISVVENGIRTRRVKRLLLVNLRELHLLYTQQYGESNPLKFSKFCTLRPKELILANARGVHNVCVCTYHGNVKLMLEAIGQTREFRSRLMDSLVCKNEVDGEVLRKDECMLGTCAQCARPDQYKHDDFVKLVTEKLKLKHLEDGITYSQWTSAETRGGLVTVIASSEDFSESLYCQFVTLMPHHYISAIQAARFKYMRTTDFLSDDKAVIQADFGENFSFLVQDAPQSFHWETTQATIHVKCISAAAISDERRHDTETIFGFLKVFLNWLLAQCPNLKHIEYWTDGCAGQYKNRKNFYNLNYHAKDFGVSAAWNFFATSHGKGAVDGISARIKDSARRQSMRAVNVGHILDALDLYRYSVTALPNIHLFYVTIEDVQKYSLQHNLESRFDCSSTYPQTRMCHRLVTTNLEILMFRTSIDQTPFYPNHTKKNEVPAALTLGQWLAVRYSTTWYLSMITALNEDSGLVQVHFVDKPGSSPSFKFSGRVDHNTAWIPITDIITTISPSTGKTARTRSQFYISNVERSLIEASL